MRMLLKTVIISMSGNGTFLLSPKIINVCNTKQQCKIALGLFCTLVAPVIYSGWLFSIKIITPSSAGSYIQLV